MGIGKILAYATGGLVVGVAAVAAAPFTGGGSILGVTTLATSLAGTAAVAGAATAGVAGASAGFYAARREDEESENLKTELSKQAIKVDELTNKVMKASETFQGDREYFNYIIGLTAIGLAMANVDGNIADEELCEIQEFIGGIANSNYPEWVKNAIDYLGENPPNLMTAMQYIAKINPSNYDSIRALMELVMLADGVEHPREIAFMQAFETQILQISYQPETLDSDNTFISEILKSKSKV
jgi:hypothetical protein